jgi:hypothetical protein
MTTMRSELESHVPTEGARDSLADAAGDDARGDLEGIAVTVECPPKTQTVRIFRPIGLEYPR